MKTWFVTGASRGLGRAFATAALARGDQVAATARDRAAVADLTNSFGDHVLPLQLDVTDRASIDAAVTETVDRFGRIDVVVNNAGYGLVGAVEEITEEQLRALMETNFFGPLRVTQAVLPTLRAQGSGHLIQISSIGGVTAFSYLGGYYASKWALEGLSESLSHEISGFGIRLTLVEPAGYATGAAAINVTAAANPAYDAVRDAFFSAAGGQEQGDPEAAAQALLMIVDAQNPPLRVLFGAAALPVVQQVYAGRLQTWSDWDQAARAAQGGTASA